MTGSGDISFFFDPKSVAVIGASERIGSWGHLITRGLVERNYPGRIFPVNPNARSVLGIPTYSSLSEVPGDVAVVFIAIPAEKLQSALTDCAKKKARGAVIISSGFGEALGEDGKKKEKEIALFGEKNGIRIIGPNVSGIFNTSRNFHAAAANPAIMSPSKMTFICQGGYAVNNLMDRAYSKGISVGKFVQTGNEADIQCIDFLELEGKDPDTEVILMYIEGLKEPRRFLDIAREITPQKPVIIYKGGETDEGTRAAASHTGAMAGVSGIYHGLFEQAGCIKAPNFESMLELGHAFQFYPPLRGPRIAIFTMGGSWGVMLTDCLISKGLQVPELSLALQKKLRDIGMPYRASTENPVDIGAAATSLDMDAWGALVNALLEAEEIDAVIIHGIGQPGLKSESVPDAILKRREAEEEFLRMGVKLMKRYDKPLLIGNLMSPLESPTIKNLALDGIPAFTRLQDIADFLFLLLHYNEKSST